MPSFAFTTGTIAHISVGVLAPIFTVQMLTHRHLTLHDDTWVCVEESQRDVSCSLNGGVNAMRETIQSGFFVFPGSTLVLKHVLRAGWRHPKNGSWNILGTKSDHIFRMSLFIWGLFTSRSCTVLSSNFHAFRNGLFSAFLLLTGAEWLEAWFQLSFYWVKTWASHLISYVLWLLQLQNASSLFFYESYMILNLKLFFSQI